MRPPTSCWPAWAVPPAFTTFLRSIGDEVTRCDRIETELNSNLPGDERDTTTPRAMADTMLRIFTQDVLSLASRALLIDWMIAAPGLDRVRKGLPKAGRQATRPARARTAHSTIS